MSGMKECNTECRHCEPYNEAWAVCWHPKIKGSRVQTGGDCTVEKITASRFTKQTAVKPIRTKIFAGEIIPTCPRCDEYVANKYCSNCGQKLNWVELDAGQK